MKFQAWVLKFLLEFLAKNQKKYFLRKSLISKSKRGFLFENEVVVYHIIFFLSERF